jgi:hypothetical protein
VGHGRGEEDGCGIKRKSWRERVGASPHPPRLPQATWKAGGRPPSFHPLERDAAAKLVGHIRSSESVLVRMPRHGCGLIGGPFGLDRAVFHHSCHPSTTHRAISHQASARPPRGTGELSREVDMRAHLHCHEHQSWGMIDTERSLE